MLRYSEIPVNQTILSNSTSTHACICFNCISFLLKIREISTVKFYRWPIGEYFNIEIPPCIKNSVLGNNRSTMNCSSKTNLYSCYEEQQMQEFIIFVIKGLYCLSLCEASIITVWQQNYNEYVQTIKCLLDKRNQSQ